MLAESERRHNGTLVLALADKHTGLGLMKRRERERCFAAWNDGKRRTVKR